MGLLQVRIRVVSQLRAYRTRTSVSDIRFLWGKSLELGHAGLSAEPSIQDHTEARKK